MNQTSLELSNDFLKLTLPWGRLCQLPPPPQFFFLIQAKVRVFHKYSPMFVT